MQREKILIRRGTSSYERDKMIKKALLYFYNCLRKKIVNFLPKSFTKKNKIAGYISYSQACQDVFVRLMLGDKKNGIYVEIGAYDEIDHSNTYILERDYGWRGVSIEIDEIAARDFNLIRKNKCILHDATSFDFCCYFKENNYPSQLDYLSLDIEPAQQTLQVLKLLPLEKYRFSVITYEHDCYVSGSECMAESRRVLESFGYKRVVSNVLWEGRDFEDWYIDPNTVPEEEFKKYISSNVVPRDLIKRVKNIS